MILMSGWMPNPNIAVAVMGIAINTSGAAACGHLHLAAANC